MSKVVQLRNSLPFIEHNEPELTQQTASAPVSPVARNVEQVTTQETDQKETDTDAQFVALVQSGQKQAFRMLVDKYQHKIAHVLGRYISEPADINDLAQDVFIRAYRSLKNFRGESSFYTWLFRIAINVAKTHYATQGRRKDFEQLTAEPEQEGPQTIEQDTPENLLCAEQLKATVFETMDTLPKELKMALVLREVEGLNYEEIATVLKCPVGTVRSRIHRAREAVDKRIKHLL